MGLIKGFHRIAANVVQVLFLVTFRDITAFKQPIVDDEKEVGGIGGRVFFKITNRILAKLEVFLLVCILMTRRKL